MSTRIELRTVRSSIVSVVREISKKSVVGRPFSFVFVRIFARSCVFCEVVCWVGGALPTSVRSVFRLVYDTLFLPHALMFLDSIC